MLSYDRWISWWNYEDYESVGCIPDEECNGMVPWSLDFTRLIHWDTDVLIVFIIYHAYL